MRHVAALMMVVATASLAVAEEDLDKAKAYFAAGVDAYDQGKFEVALREFQHAHALSHAPLLYFNMAQCEEHMDHFQAAALLLRQYLIEKPDADDRANVELRIKSLEDRDERLHKMPDEPATQPVPSATATVAAPTTPPMAQPEKRHLKWTWVALGVTGAAGITAIALGAYTVTHHSTLASGCGMTAGGCSSGEISGLRATANATDALLAVTAVAAVATVVAAVVETRHARRYATTPRAMAFDRDGTVRF